MSTNVKSSAGSADIGGSAGANEFEGCIPAHVTVAKVMDPHVSDVVWRKIYRSAAVHDAAEGVKKALRCAFYTYCAINGTSPMGEYKGEVVSGKGTTVRAAALPDAAGRYDIRQFMRANASESVRYFRTTRVLEEMEAIRAKCEQLQMPVSQSIALCDWLDTNTGLTPAEQDAASRIRNFSFARSSGARGDRTMEEIREDDYGKKLAAQHAPRIPPVSNSGF